MPGRHYTPLDRLIAELDTALRVVAAPARAVEPSPAACDDASGLGPRERRRSAALMRVNHAGEVSAQALYRGQAAVTRDPELRDALLEAADEEHNHLAWCADRVRQLRGHRSLLGPAWYAGAFGMGAAAGLAGDRISLGFLAETERQVADHLEGHLRRLPPGDTASRRIVERMRSDEIGHQNEAIERGAVRLPLPVRSLMKAGARVMTTLARWV